jgi:hypothetical protein
MADVVAAEVLAHIVLHGQLDGQAVMDIKTDHLMMRVKDLQEAQDSSLVQEVLKCGAVVVAVLDHVAKRPVHPHHGLAQAALE